MPKPTRPHREHFATQDPNLSIVLCDDGSRTLKCHNRGITWHSESGAIAESQLVFLENSRVAERLKANEVTRVFEVGFGTGLNFWLSATLAIQCGSKLEYISLEPYLLPTEIIESLRYGDNHSCDAATQHFTPTFGHQSFSTVTLELLPEKLQSLNPERYVASFDAIYHDPFSPEAATELWTEETFQRLHATLKPSGRLVTYCVKSEVQRRLKSAGFVVSKTRGPIGGKREVLIAEKN